MQYTGAQIVIEALLEQGTDVIFGYPGGNAINIYEALWQNKDRMRHVLVSHEQGSAHAADGYARATGKVGVCLATSGPGATNLVTGIATAHLDSVPMIAITANVPRDLLGKDSFQEVDITGVTVPVTKHNYFVRDVNDLAQTIKNAFEVAVSGRPGPVLIDIPKDITAELCEYIPVGKYQKRKMKPAKEKNIEKAVEMINAAKKPVIYFGGGIVISNAEEELKEFARKTDSPLTSTTKGLSAVPYDFHNYLGLQGMHGTPVSNYAISESDLLIAIGARFSDRAIGKKSEFAKNAKIIHIDIDYSEISKNIHIDHEIIGDAKQILEELNKRVDTRKLDSWNEQLKEYKISNPMCREYDPGKLGVDPRKVLDAIKTEGGEDTIIVTDVGQHQMTTAQFYKFTHPRTFLSSLGLGTMGYGMGAANGAKVGCPDKPVALITGDGCFHMNMNELAVAVTERLPLVVIIMNNGVLGMVRQWQKLFYEEHYSETTLNRQTNYVKLAEAMGAVGYRITKNDDIVPTLKKAFSQDGPAVIDCIIDIDEGVFPIIPPGGTVNDMILHD